MTRFFDFRGGRGAFGLLVLRLVVGFALVLHGLEKIQSKGGIAGWNPGLPPFWQFMASIGEFGGGLGMMVGFLTPIACFGIICTMAVAIIKVHLPAHSAFVGHAGSTFELPAAYLVSALAVMLAGPGAISLDALVFGRVLATRPLARE